MSDETIKKRLKVVRLQLNKKNINCLLLTKPPNVTYTTGFSGDDSYSLITPTKVYLITDSRYTEQAKSECPNCKIIQRSGSMAQAVGKLVKKLKSVRTVTIENSTSLADFQALKKTVKARLKSADNIIESARIIKDSSEITAIKTAAKIAAGALKKTLRYIKPGISENELAGMLDFQIRKQGATNSFETIVAFGPNASRAHHQPTTKKLKKTDTVLIDFGAKYKNYCSDITRCFAIGKVNRFYKKVYEALQQAQTAAIETIKAGVDITRVDTAARNVICKFDLPVYGHGTGHGLGLEVHEKPIVAKKIKGVLKAGTVFTIEPGVYIPGKLGIRIEDDILVTETGYKILTEQDPRLHILNPSK